LTGASSGIGRHIALQLVDAGALVLATARRADRLRDLENEIRARGLGTAAAEFSILPGDITDPAHRAALMEHAHSRWSALDVLINNAGAGAIGPFDRSSQDKLRRVMEVDFFAPVELTRLTLPLLAEGRRPAVALVGSVLGHRAVPFKSEYCAAKFALRGWAESLRCELARQGIDVLLISPSTTRTEFFDSLIESPGAKSMSIGSMDPGQVATKVLRSIRAGRRDAILSLGGKALVWAGRLWPGWTDKALGRVRT
jgi:short-subunit dehydrogenase